jgi:CubicO group peptidase (beta-lactamase class C family)
MAELEGDDAKTYYYPDLRQLALEETEVVDPPGEYFLYNNYHPLLLGLILERATGTLVADYLQEKIWTPLGMEYDGSWSLDSEASGFEKMESGINARAIDFAKLGRLYLNNGSWEGTQVLPAAWVADSTQMDPSVDYATYYRYPDRDSFFLRSLTSAEGYYKYMWWGIRRGKDDYDFAAVGDYGQYLYVSPHKNLIIVRHGEKFGIAPADWMEGYYEYAGNIEP